MTIQFDCQCGKHFSVPDTMAGSKARCKECGNVLTVPASNEGLEELEPLEPLPPPAAPGKLVCPSCGKQYPWKAELAGKKVTCQGCKTTFTATGPAPAAPPASPAKAAPPAKKPVAPVVAKLTAPAKPADDLFDDDALPMSPTLATVRDPDEDDDEEEAPKPKAKAKSGTKKKKKSGPAWKPPENLVQILGGVGGVIALLVMGWVAWSYLGPDSYEKIGRDMLATMETMAGYLENVTDDASARKAAANIESLESRIRALGVRMNKLGRPPKEIQDELRKNKDMEKRAQESQSRFTTAMGRITANPQWAQIIMPAMMKAMKPLAEEATKPRPK
jgi:hypothetical protein